MTIDHISSGGGGGWVGYYDHRNFLYNIYCNFNIKKVIADTYRLLTKVLNSQFLFL